MGTRFAVVTVEVTVLVGPGPAVRAARLTVCSTWSVR